MSRAPAAMRARGQGNPRASISVRTRWGWGPSASEKTTCLALALAFLAAVPVAALAQADISGAWEVTIDSPQGAMAIEASFKQVGEAVTGLVMSPFGSVELKGTLVNDALSFDYSVPLQGQNLDITMAGKVTGDTMTGTVAIVGLGEVPWTAKRKPAGASATTTVAPAALTDSVTAPSSAAGASSATGIAGKWDVVLAIAGLGEFPMGATFTQTEDKVTGMFSGLGGEIPVSGTMTGTALKLEFVASTPQGDIPVTMTGELGPKGLAGTADLAGLGEATWIGTRPQP